MSGLHLEVFLKIGKFDALFATGNVLSAACACEAKWRGCTGVSVNVDECSGECRE